MGDAAKENFHVVDGAGDVVSPRVTHLGARRRIAAALGCAHDQLTVDEDGIVLGPDGGSAGYSIVDRSEVEQL